MSDNEDDLPPVSAEASGNGGDDDENGLSASALPDDIAPVSLVAEMRKSYLDYAMSVIVSRALPDVRDGLKPVHRRILYTAKTGGYEWNRAYRKSAHLVGGVMGGYHPPAPLEAYYELGAQLARRGVHLVTGGGGSM